MNIEFANGTYFGYLDALATEERYNGASRRTLTFECAEDVISIDELNALLSDEANTKVITLTNGKEKNIYDGYVLKLEVGIRNRLVQAETPDTPAVYADRLVFKLGRRTFVEEQLARLGV